MIKVFLAISKKNLPSPVHSINRNSKSHQPMTSKRTVFITGGHPDNHPDGPLGWGAGGELTTSTWEMRTLLHCASTSFQQSCSSTDSTKDDPTGCCQLRWLRQFKKVPNETVHIIHTCPPCCHLRSNRQDEKAHINEVDSLCWKGWLQSKMLTL